MLVFHFTRLYDVLPLFMILHLEQVHFRVKIGVNIGADIESDTGVNLQTAAFSGIFHGTAADFVCTVVADLL
jgi:hypothetical protein